MVHNWPSCTEYIYIRTVYTHAANIIPWTERRNWPLTIIKNNIEVAIIVYITVSIKPVKMPSLSNCTRVYIHEGDGCDVIWARLVTWRSAVLTEPSIQSSPMPRKSMTPQKCKTICTPVSVGKKAVPLCLITLSWTSWYAIRHRYSCTHYIYLLLLLGIDNYMYVQFKFAVVRRRSVKIAIQGDFLIHNLNTLWRHRIFIFIVSGCTLDTYEFDTSATYATFMLIKYKYYAEQTYISPGMSG